MKTLFKPIFLAIGILSLTAVPTYAMDNDAQTPSENRDRDGDIKMTTQTEGILAALDKCGTLFQDPNFHSYAPRNEQTLYACMMIMVNKKPISGVFNFTMEAYRLAYKYDRLSETKKYKNRDTLLLTTQALQETGLKCVDQDTKRCEQQLASARYIFNLLKTAHDADTIKK